MSLLYIDACILGDASRTKRLATTFLDTYFKTHPEDALTTREIAQHPITPLNSKDYAKREALMAAGKLDATVFSPAWEFAEAEHIVIATPFWDLSFPAVVKAYLEQVSVAGIAFNYTETGSVGLCAVKDLTFITTRGDITTGDLAFLEQGARYLEALSQIYGIPRFQCIAAEGLDIEGLDVPEIMAQAEHQAKEAASAL
ncbi:FMN-dependent NADH-azoreductase [Eubacterium aggregans]|uniref:FMN-dependent NADH-azoreductase n=1 Tax=Eubacterium aggregans TaxID=81409 RepID=UPI003F3F2280